jgi:tight adherence protein B
MLKGKIQALTSQGKLQALIMACLPVLLAAVLTWLDPGSMAMFWETPAGWAVIALVVLLDAAGLVLIRRIVDIKV